MIDPKKLPRLREDIETLESRLSFFAEKVKNSKDIDAIHRDSPEEERSYILTLVEGHRQKLSGIFQLAEKECRKSNGKGNGASGLLKNLLLVDETVRQAKADIEKISENQYGCKLELLKQEIVVSLEDMFEQFDFIIPNIRDEIVYMEKFYRIPGNISNSILPQLQELVYDLEKRRISLKEFVDGYEFSSGKKVSGYNELRSCNGVFSKYQYYENSQESYKEINTCLYEICSAIEPLLYEKKEEPEFRKFFSSLVEEKGQKISTMKDIFEYQGIFRSLIAKVGKTFSFREEYKKAKGLIDQFFGLQKALVVYNEEELARTEKALAGLFADPQEKAKFQAILGDLRAAIAEKTVPFQRIEAIYARLVKKDFNVVVEEKSADDITIKITPHLEDKFGRNLLERINTVIQEIDFWYPAENKQLLFQDLGARTQAIQMGEAESNKEFLSIIQKYDQEIEQNIRKTYPNWINLLNIASDNFQNAFADKLARERLEKRLLNNKEIWNDVNLKFKKAKTSLSVLTSNASGLKDNVNKFPFIKQAVEELSQLFYDLSMQLFVLYKGLDNKSIVNMTTILSTFNEFHDVKSLAAAFYHYLQKGALANYHVNEKVMIELTQNPLCKAKIQKLIPDES